MIRADKRRFNIPIRIRPPSDFRHESDFRFDRQRESAPIWRIETRPHSSSILMPREESASLSESRTSSGRWITSVLFQRRSLRLSFATE
jgi:hypothetical protein